MQKLYYLSWVDEENLAHSEVLVPRGGKLLVGRALTADIVVSNPSVSRIHAQLLWQNNLLTIEDLHSSYGTWVNDKRLGLNQNIPLYESGEIRLGNLSIWYEIRDKHKNQDILQTCFFPTQQAEKLQLSSELKAFKTKLLKSIKDISDNKLLLARFEASLDGELYTLNEKHQEQLKEQKILNSISHILNRSLTLSELSKNALDLISKVLSADRGFIVLYNKDEKQFNLIAKRNFNESEEISQIHRDESYSSTLIKRCYESGQIIIVNDAQNKLPFANLESIVSSGACSILAIPLNQHDQVVGVIYLDSSGNNSYFEERHIPFLETFSAHTSIALHNANLYKRAITDDLTKLFTRKYIDERLEQEIDRAKRYHRPFSVLIIDLDHFKNINDTYGHSAGDLVLQTVSYILRRRLRDTDVAGRFGGEEFIVILGETEQKGAFQFAERIREEIEQKTIEKEGQLIKVTASIGLSSYQSRHSEQFRELIEDADSALYQAKENGRNQVIIAE